MWDEEAQVWRVRTDRGDTVAARFVVMANGCLSEPKLAVLPGMASFKGKSFHTSRWDYAYTGQDLSKLEGKRVGVVGTGATAVQVVPQLAQVPGLELFVFQRTPSSIDVRGDFATDEEWAAKLKPGWSLARRQAFDESMSGGFTRAPTLPPMDKAAYRIRMRAEIQKANAAVMQSLRERVDAVVADPATAAALKPWYPLGCKRPCVHDEYLPAFNQANVHLVDTKGRGVEEVREAGVVAGGAEHPLDVLIFATGFEFCKVGTFNAITGRDGASLGEKWSEGGISTYLGMHTRGFPNMFIMGGPQAFGAAFNFMSVIEEQAKHVLQVVAHLRRTGARAVDVTPQAEADYTQFCVDAAGKVDWNACVSYYNAEGTARAQDLPYSSSSKVYYGQLAAAQAALAVREGKGKGKAAGAADLQVGECPFDIQ